MVQTLLTVISGLYKIHGVMVGAKKALLKFLEDLILAV